MKEKFQFSIFVKKRYKRHKTNIWNERSSHNKGERKYFFECHLKEKIFYSKNRLS